MDRQHVIFPSVFKYVGIILIKKMIYMKWIFRADKFRQKFLRLDGSTAVTARQDIIDEFTTDLSVPIFLLSTKAGGVGTNLFKIYPNFFFRN